MKFFKNEIPEINKILKDDKGQIIIIHSEGELKVKNTDIQNLRMTNDIHSTIKSDENQKLILYLISFCLTGGIFNIIKKYTFGLFHEPKTNGDYWLISIFGNEYDLWFNLAFFSILFYFICKLLKELPNFIKALLFWTEYEQDILVLRLQMHNLQFRIKHPIPDNIFSIKINTEGQKTKSRKWNFLYFFLASLVIIFFNKNCPYWFYDNEFGSYILRNNFSDCVELYYKSKIGLIGLFYDGLMSNFIVASITINLILIVRYIVFPFVALIFVLAILIALYIQITYHLPWIILVLFQFVFILNLFLFLSYKIRPVEKHEFIRSNTYMVFGVPLKLITFISLCLAAIILIPVIFISIPVLFLASLFFKDKIVKISKLSSEKFTSYFESLKCELKLVLGTQHNGIILAISFLGSFLGFGFVQLIVYEVGLASQENWLFDFITHIFYQPLHNLFLPIKEKLLFQPLLQEDSVSFIQLEKPIFIILSVLPILLIAYLIDAIISRRLKNKSLISRHHLSHPEL